MEAVMFDLDETILDRTASLKDFLHWQVQGMLQSDIAMQIKIFSLKDLLSLMLMELFGKTKYMKTSLMDFPLLSDL